MFRKCLDRRNEFRDKTSSPRGEKAAVRGEMNQRICIFSTNGNSREIEITQSDPQRIPDKLLQ